MKLSKFSYKDADWEIEDLNLQTVNLIVGENGTGKTRFLTYLYQIKNFISNKWEDIFIHGNQCKWIIEFQIENSDVIRYEISITHDGKKYECDIHSEKLFKNDFLLVERDSDKFCKIYSEISKQYDSFNPPNDKLAILSRRDTKAYPFTERIIEWAKNSFMLTFSEINEQHRVVELLSEHLDFSQLYPLLNKQEQQNILDYCNEIGFHFENIKIHELGKNLNALMIKEYNVESEIIYYGLSQGMLRALCLLIYIEYLISKEKTATILIDDLGEGLDYRRATELGKIIFKRCLENNIQLIATSNDNFLMNVVDIDYWNVLIREGKVVKAINKVNHPTIFEDFRFEGTSNFNFFSSSFLPSRL